MRASSRRALIAAVAILLLYLIHAHQLSPTLAPLPADAAEARAAALQSRTGGAADPGDGVGAAAARAQKPLAPPSPDSPDAPGSSGSPAATASAPSSSTPPLASPAFDQWLRSRLAARFPYPNRKTFPAYIWQTWRVSPASGDFPSERREAEASWTMSHPGFVHSVVDDESAPALLAHLYAGLPQVLAAYHALPVPVMRADFFRYLVLLARGGIYADIDTAVLKSADRWLGPIIGNNLYPNVPEPETRGFDPARIGLVVGIEADPDRPDWHTWYSRRIQLCQWTIQAKPGHPALVDVVANITATTLRLRAAADAESVANATTTAGGGRASSHVKPRPLIPDHDKSVLEWTGPAVWTDAVFRSMAAAAAVNEPGRNVSAPAFSRLRSRTLVGDTLVLPITSFSPGVQQMGSEEIDSPWAFVQHDFAGSWKPEAERVIGGDS